MIKISVIIPFFQREAGILAGALRSVLEQQLDATTSVDIVVVDDGSPAPVEAELEGLRIAAPFSLRVLRRSNGGPGAARNTGLESLAEDTTFVAFLDSDDRWRDQHLQSALAVLGDDADFYFSDHEILEQPISYFHSLLIKLPEAKEAPAGIPDLYLTHGRRFYAHPAGVPNAFALSGNDALVSLLKCYLAHTSTIVYRHEVCSELRFETAMRSAGEDYLFTLMLATRARLVRYSTAVNMVRGRGVNIYLEAVSWNHPGNLQLTLDRLRCFLFACGDEKIVSSVRNRSVYCLLRRQVNRYRTEFVYIWFRRLILSRSLNAAVLIQAIREDRGLALRLPLLLAAACARKLLGLRVVSPV